jgi:Phage integrase family
MGEPRTVQTSSVSPESGNPSKPHVTCGFCGTAMFSDPWSEAFATHPYSHRCRRSGMLFSLAGWMHLAVIVIDGTFEPIPSRSSIQSHLSPAPKAEPPESSEVSEGHFAAVTDPSRLAVILRMIDGYKGTLPVRSALRLARLLFVRPGELRQAEWKDIDLDAAEWRFRVRKTQTNHIVPLSQQALQILRELHQLTGCSRFVFPSARSNGRPMSDNALLAAMRSMGMSKSELTTHGFRATARTILDEVLKVRPDYVEHQLAHAVRDPNGRAYNRTAFLPERHEMMQSWSDYLDELKKPVEN